jgi:hypothetical protein
MSGSTCFLRHHRTTDLLEKYVNRALYGVFVLKKSSFGGVPERSKGSDCKSDGLAFEGSNPSPTTTLRACVQCDEFRKKCGTEVWHGAAA